jgi:hypothetical protein
VHRFFGTIATTLVAVLLATVLAPSFGWEASARQAAHGHEVLEICGANGADEGSLPATQDNPDRPKANQHHGCAAHMLGHLVATLSDAGDHAVLGADEVGVLDRLPSVSSVSPRRLDRPPLDSRLA